MGRGKGECASAAGRRLGWGAPGLRRPCIAPFLSFNWFPSVKVHDFSFFSTHTAPCPEALPIPNHSHFSLIFWKECSSIERVLWLSEGAVLTPAPPPFLAVVLKQKKHTCSNQPTKNKQTTNKPKKKSQTRKATTNNNKTNKQTILKKTFTYSRTIDNKRNSALFTFESLTYLLQQNEEEGGMSNSEFVDGKEGGREEERGKGPANKQSTWRCLLRLVGGE